MRLRTLLIFSSVLLLTLAIVSVGAYDADAYKEVRCSNAQNQARTRKSLPYRFLIPEGYVGWVRVDFDVPGAPPLTVEDGFYLFRFPVSGRLRTSSSDIVESRRNEFFYYSTEGTYRIHEGGPLEVRLVQQEFSGPGPGHRAPVPNRYRYIFIGPTEVFDAYQAKDKSNDVRESDGYPKVGAKNWLTRDYLVTMKIKKP